MKNDFKNCLIIGFALFAMFFGAGNLIFPIYSGLVAGNSAPYAAIAFVLTGVGIPFLSILAGTKSNGSFQDMASQVGKTFGVACTVILMITIGPLVASPRTAATTFELALSPLVPRMSPVVGMVIFYAVNIALILKPSTIVDTIGKILTPTLLVILIILIVKGIIYPLGPTTDPRIDSVFFTSLIEGYQTMDALTALAFSSIIINSIISKGYAKKDIFKTTVKSGIISIVCLAVVYGGLVYLGHTASTIYPDDIPKTQLLLNISYNLLGNGGTVLIGIAMALACLTTSMCVISSAASYFEQLSRGKLPYKFNVLIMCIIGGFIGVLGVDKIVVLAGPLLSMLYPICITLILLTLGKKFVKNNLVVKYSVYVTLIFSVIDVFKPFGLNTIIPLSDLGFGWVIPTVITFLICNLIIFNKQYTISDNLSKFEVE